MREKYLNSKKHDLTLGQKELWFIHSMGGEARSAYNEPLVYSLIGRVKKSVLVEAFNALINKHELLRTSFDKDSEGNLVQILHDQVILNFT